MYEIKSATALTVPFFAFDANGTGVTGMLTGDWTWRISKASGVFGAMTVTTTEMEGGWYQLVMTTSHTDTLGLLSVYGTHASCKSVNLQWRVVTRLPDERAFPEVAGRAIDVTSGGNVGIDLDNTVGTLAKGTEITGFNDVSTSEVQTYAQAGASLALATYHAVVPADLAVAVSSLTAAITSLRVHEDALAASLALTAYDAPTHTEMTNELAAGFAALNDITVAEIAAMTIDTLSAPAVTLHLDDALLWVVSYISGNIAKASTTFTYKDGSGATVWSNDVQPAARTRS